MRIIVLLSALIVVNCATAEKPAPAPAPTPALVTTESSLEQARAIVADFEARLPLAADNPLLHPTTFADVFSILRLDQVRLFPAGAAYAKQLGTTEGTAMHGQIELAWGEAYIILVEVMADLQQNLARTVRELHYQSAARPLSDDQLDKLETLEENLRYLERTTGAFKTLAMEHITAGAKSAHAVIAAIPDSYLGYRVAADYYRMGRDWESFNTMTDKIRATNEDSNGLVFLLATEAYQRRGDTAEAEVLFNKALATDPQFVRAQAHLLLMQEAPQKLYQQLLALEKINPDHQLVHWAGPAIRQAFEQWQQSQE